MTSLDHGNVDVLAQTAKARQSEQGALKQGGIDLLVMPPKLKGRLPLWRACSVGRLRRLVKRRNYISSQTAAAKATGSSGRMPSTSRAWS